MKTNNQLGAKLQHCGMVISAAWIACRDSIWGHKQCFLRAAVFQVWCCIFWLSEPLLYCSSRWLSLENSQPAWRLILPGLQRCPLMGAPSSKAFWLDSAMLHHWKRWRWLFRKPGLRLAYLSYDWPLQIQTGHSSRTGLYLVDREGLMLLERLVEILLMSMK